MHKERNLLAHAPKHLHEEVKAEFNDMVHAKTAADVQAKRKAFLAKWKLRCRPVADSLEEAGEHLFTFLRYPPGQRRSLRTTNAIERLHEEFKRRIKTQCLLPCAETAAMLFWALWPRVRSPYARSTAGKALRSLRPCLRNPILPSPSMTAAKPPARQRAMGALASGFAPDQLHHKAGRSRALVSPGRSSASPLGSSGDTCADAASIRATERPPLEWTPLPTSAPMIDMQARSASAGRLLGRGWARW